MSSADEQKSDKAYSTRLYLILSTHCVLRAFVMSLPLLLLLLASMNEELTLELEGC